MLPLTYLIYINHTPAVRLASVGDSYLILACQLTNLILSHHIPAVRLASVGDFGSSQPS